jgi:hypothetical protein
VNFAVTKPFFYAYCALASNKYTGSAMTYVAILIFALQINRCDMLAGYAGILHSIRSVRWVLYRLGVPTQGAKSQVFPINAT